MLLNSSEYGEQDDFISLITDIHLRDMGIAVDDFKLRANFQKNEKGDWWTVLHLTTLGIIEFGNFGMKLLWPLSIAWFSYDESLGLVTCLVQGHGEVVFNLQTYYWSAYTLVAHVINVWSQANQLTLILKVWVVLGNYMEVHLVCQLLHVVSSRPMIFRKSLSRETLNVPSISAPYWLTEYSPCQTCKMRSIRPSCYCTNYLWLSLPFPW